MNKFTEEATKPSEAVMDFINANKIGNEFVQFFALILFLNFQSHP